MAAHQRLPDKTQVMIVGAVLECNVKTFEYFLFVEFLSIYFESLPWLLPLVKDN